MPVFLCEACNETLKRNKVATHRCWAAVSCMDCNMRFVGNDYLSHTSCVTEAQRYEGALYVHKDNKGDVKQQAWLDNVQARLDAAEGSGRLRPFMERLLAYDNVPRKKAKFINFAKKCVGPALPLTDVLSLNLNPAGRAPLHITPSRRPRSCLQCLPHDSRTAARSI
jgi:cell growth-regulating nucleolar protein